MTTPNNPASNADLRQAAINAVHRFCYENKIARPRIRDRRDDALCFIGSTDDGRAAWMKSARAVIAAIREPSGLMIDEAYESYSANGGSLRDVFMDMLDAILSEEG